MNISLDNESFGSLDADDIETDELIMSASNLLNEVFKNQKVPITNKRENALDDAKKFLRTLRNDLNASEDEVVFVEAHPGTSSKRAPVVDLCSSVDEESSEITTRPRRSCGRVQKPTGRKNGNRINQIKKEAITKNEVILIEDTPPKGDTSTGEMVMLTCPVCMDGLKNKNPTSTSCGHIFCQQCITKALKLTRKCPVCNTKPKNTHRLYM